MKLRIEKEFRDKYSGKKYVVGNEVEFVDDRAKELLSDSRNLVSKVAEEKSKRSIKKSKK